MKCQRSTFTNPYGGKKEIIALNDAYSAGEGGAPAKAIHRPDGRALCPHRKVDLSQFPAGEDGITICPLHGLRVDCRKDPTPTKGTTNATL